MGHHQEAQGSGGEAGEPPIVTQLRTVIQERRLTKEFVETHEFENIRSKLLHTVKGGRPLEVWSGLSIFGRAASVSKPMAQIFLPIVDECVEAGLPEFIPLQDGEDRWYLAKALQTNPTETTADIAYSEIVRDELGEKARRVWVEIGLSSAKSRECFLSRINKNIKDHFGSKRDNSDIITRRIRRINAAIVEKIITSELSSGSSFSEQLRVFYTGHISREGPDDRKLRDEAAVEFINSLTEIVRLSFSAASDPDSYLIAQNLRRWWWPASAPQEFERSARKLVRLGSEALHVFARQGHRNKALRDSLALVAGNNFLARATQEIVSRDSSLSEELATWFCSGEEPAKRQSSAAIEALSSERLDADASRLLVYVRSSELDGREIERLAEDVAEILPEEGRSISSVAARTKQISQVVESLAKRLHIDLFLNTGEIVEFDPAQHDPINEGPIGGRVTVVRPGTRKVEPNRTPRILLKPKVRHP